VGVGIVGQIAAPHRLGKVFDLYTSSQPL
jgi:hypothetical protein